MNTIQNRVRAILTKQDQILLLHNLKDNFYAFPGGKVEFGENIFKTAERELFEELGVKFTNPKLLYIREFIDIETLIHSVEFFVTGKIDKWKELDKAFDPTDTNSQESIQFKLFDLDKLPDRLFPEAISSRLVKDLAQINTEFPIYLGESK